MKCAQCGSQVSSIHALTAKSRCIACKSCGAQGKVQGGLAFVVAPMLLFFIFPLVPLPQSLWGSVAIVALAVLASYVIAFYAFVRVSWGPPKP